MTFRSTRRTADNLKSQTIRKVLRRKTFAQNAIIRKKYANNCWLGATPLSHREEHCEERKCEILRSETSSPLSSLKLCLAQDVLSCPRFATLIEK